MKPSIFPPGSDAILQRLYPNVAAIQAEMAAAGMPSRTPKQIRLRAFKRGFTKGIGPRPFNAEEDRVIHRLYPDVEAIQREMPDRDFRRIQKRAWTIKATKNPGAFQEHEDQTIRRLYPDVPAILRALPARTEDAITRRATRLKVATAGKHSQYRAGERRMIRIFYPNYDLLLALLAPRTREAIKQTAVTMGLTKGKVGTAHGWHTQAWSDEEKAALSKYGVKLPGRSRSAIESARVRYGITVEPNPAIAAREARNAARRAKSQAEAAKRKAAAAARAEEQRRQNAVWAAKKTQEIEAKRQAQAEALARDRAATKAAREAQARTQRAPELKPVSTKPAQIKPARPAPAPVRASRGPALPQRGDDIDPRVLSAAGSSRFGLELVATVQRTVPRDLWPHVKPRVIEDLTMAVIEGRCAPDGLSEMLPGVIQAAMRNQFEGAGR